MQAIILNFFQKISNPGLDTLAELVTMLGEEYFIIAAVTFMYWNVSKKDGLKLGVVFIFSSVINNSLKILFRTPRPFEVLESVAGKRLDTATGYAFPSGHSQGAAAFFTTAALILRRRRAAIGAAAIVLSVGISQVYLGVHWPVDAAGGILIGAAAAFVFSSLIDRLSGDPAKFRLVLLGAEGGILGATILLLAFDAVFLHGSVKIGDFFKISGISLGLISGLILERSRPGFDPREGRPLVKALRYLFGIAVAVALLAGLKPLLPSNHGFTYFRYFLPGFWAAFLWPQIGLGIGVFKRERRLG
jgi:undecaprenyl-diphosphatase